MDADCCWWSFLLVAADGCCWWLLLLIAAVDCCCWLLLLIAADGCCCWLLLLVAAVDCCCWLLLLVAAVDCCWWLLLLIAAAGCCCWLLLLVASVDCCWWLLLLIAAAGCCFWLLLLVAAVDCCSKSLWIFPEYSWWFAAKTNLQAKKSWNIFESWWKVFEYFRVVGEKSLNISRILMGERWKRGSPRGSRLESEWILWLCAGYLYSAFKMAASFGESQ